MPHDDRNCRGNQPVETRKSPRKNHPFGWLLRGWHLLVHRMVQTQVSKPARVPAYVFSRKMLFVLRVAILVVVPKMPSVSFAETVIVKNHQRVATASEAHMSHLARAGKHMQNRLYPQTVLSLTYNYNQMLGANNQSQQNEIAFAPVIPIRLGDGLQLLINPVVTYNQNLNDSQAPEQWEPVQLATFFAPQYSGDWYLGLGPYFQAPAANASDGSRQTGLGVSAGAYYTPGNWVFGFTMYNAWGVGDQLSGGSANALDIQPVVSYTTKQGWSYSLSGQYNYGYTANSSSTQLTLSAAKTLKIGGTHWQFQVGPTYMVTSHSMSAKGWGGYFGLTITPTD